jgi:hypothetical protein
LSIGYYFPQAVVTRQTANVARLLRGRILQKPDTGNRFLVFLLYDAGVAEWSFLTNHARALLYIARDPDARLRTIADALDVTERTAFGIVADLSKSGYVVKEKDGRRNRYVVQPHLPLRDSISRGRPIGEVLELLGADTRATKPRPRKTERRTAKA